MSTPPIIPTLEDVAKEAGVSTATVSRCLNNKANVSMATQRRVMAAAEALKYTPNFNARAMVAKRSNTVGAIIPTMENAIFAQGLQAFQETLHNLNYNLLVSSSAYQPKLEAEQIRELVARGADGLLLIGYERDDSVYEFLKSRGVPAMVAWASLPYKGHASVGFDNRSSMRMLADHVISMGHKRVGVISGITDGNDRAKERLNGIRDSWRAHSLNINDLHVIQTPYQFENGATAFETLMVASQKPTVVMCGNDVLAAGAISKARELGLNIPNDVSVTGFDDIELARYVFPALTTVHVPHRSMGRIAAQNLVDLIEHRTENFSHQLDVSIVMRDTLRRI